MPIFTILQSDERLTPISLFTYKKNSVYIVGRHVELLPYFVSYKEETKSLQEQGELADPIFSGQKWGTRRRRQRQRPDLGPLLVEISTFNVLMDSTLPHEIEFPGIIFSPAKSMNPQPNEAVVTRYEHTISLFEPDLILQQLGVQHNTDDSEATNIPFNSGYMMAKLNQAVLSLDRSRVDLLDDFNQVGFSTDSAHLVAWLGLQSFLEDILNRCPSLFFSRNSRGDTLLHVAARAGQLGIVKYLLATCNSSRDDVQRRRERDGGADEKAMFLKMENDKGNTALHETLEYDQENQDNVARFLVQTDPQLSYLVNKVGKSPAYLAAEAGRLTLLEYMFESVGDVNNHSKWRGKTPLHAVILTRRGDSLELVLRLKPQLIRVTDKKGRNPIHYAASIGYYYGLLELLKIDTLAAYQPDDDGVYPIHMAASSGHIEVIQLFLQVCSLFWVLHSKEGHNILHVAAQSGKKNVVKYILKKRTFESLINRLDGKGNTPLHLATKGKHFKVVRALSRDSRVIKSITNNDNFTALDIAEENIVTGASFRRLLTLTALRIANAPRAPSNLNISGDKYSVNNDGQQRVDKKVNNDGQQRVDKKVNNDGQQRVDKNEQQAVNKAAQGPEVKFYKGRVNTLLLVSTLVATITFTAGFTIPGGLTSDGTATMLTNTMFKVFVICDTTALFCSILAVISLIWAQVGDIRLMGFILGFTLPLMGISLSIMAIAFAAGLYIVTSQLHWLATTVFIMTMIFLVCTIALLLPLQMPMQSRHSFFQRIIYYFLYLLESATGSSSDSNVTTSNEDKGEIKPKIEWAIAQRTTRSLS